MTHQHRVVQAVAVAATITGLAVPAAVAQDLRSPDARDAAAPAQQSVSPPSDLRSPDVRDVAGSAQQLATPASDLRSPDVRDAASRVVSAAITPAADAGVSNGFQWGDAAIGAGAAVAAIALAAGMLVAGRRRLHHGGMHIAH
jgi:hypothetical protein